MVISYSQACLVLNTYNYKISLILICYNYLAISISFDKNNLYYFEMSTYLSSFTFQIKI